eukprot:3494168-Pleurochrysis_carterae.AAC.2
MLRRPSRRCLLRRGALRVAIGADTRFVRLRGKVDGIIAGGTMCSDSTSRRKRAASEEGKAIAASITVSLSRSSSSSTQRAAFLVSSGAVMRTCPTALMAQLNAGLRSARDTRVTRVEFAFSASPSTCETWIQYVCINATARQPAAVAS